MARHHSSSASKKHKSSSRSRQKKHSNSSGSVKPKIKRVAFGGASSTSSDFRTHIPLQHGESKDQDASRKLKNALVKETTMNNSRSSRREHSSTKEPSSSKGHNDIQTHSSTSGILKSRDKHTKSSIHSSKGSKSSRTIPTPTKLKAKHKQKDKKTRAVHPYAARFSESIRQRTGDLLTTLPQQLKSITSGVLKSLSSVNNCETTGKSYHSLGISHQASIITKYGSAIQLDVVKGFQENCKVWDRELKLLFQEYTIVQQEMINLANEIGLSKSVDKGKRDESGEWDSDSDVEFEELVKEIKRIGKTWVTKMDKLEKQIFQEESRQNMLMMQAM